MMSNLIERLRGYGPLITDEAADEIERLNCALTISRGKHENAIAWNAKQKAVVDAVKHLLAGGDKEALYYLEQALAALETDDEIERLQQDRLCRCADEVRCEMRAEIERLIEALRFCAGRMEHPRCPRCAERQEVARAALENDDE